jgi:hypothetical protein
MKIVTGLFHSHQGAKQALDTLERHKFIRKESVTLIDPSKVSHNSLDEQAGSAFDSSLIRLGISAQKAFSYSRSLKQGSKLIVVKAEDQRALEALNLLYEAGAAESDYRALAHHGE